MSSQSQILVVDNNRPLCQIYKLYFKKLGLLDVRSCSTGTEALELISKIQFGLIVVEIVLPEMDGYELIRRVRETDQHSDVHVPILVITTRERDERECLGIGADAFLVKPVEFADLRSRLLQLGVIRNISEQPDDA